MKENNNGEYYYTPIRTHWGVYRRIRNRDGSVFCEKICNCITKEEARRKMYELNGWENKQN